MQFSTLKMKYGAAVSYLMNHQNKEGKLNATWEIILLKLFLGAVFLVFPHICMLIERYVSLPKIQCRMHSQSQNSFDYAFIGTLWILYDLYDSPPFVLMPHMNLLWSSLSWCSLVSSCTEHFTWSLCRSPTGHSRVCCEEKVKAIILRGLCCVW